MTRKEELAERAKAIIDEMAFRPFYPLQSEISKTLLQVERECWRKIIDEVEYRRHTVTMDQQPLIDWLRDQLKEVGG